MTTMTAAKKYDFANSFDTNERGLIAARDFTLADMEKARAEGFEAGHAAGAATERASIEHAAANALARIDTGLSMLMTELTAAKERLERESLETVLQIARKLMPHYVKMHGIAEIEGIVRDCLNAVYEEPRIVIRARETILAHLNDRLDALLGSSGFNGKVVMFADPALPEDHCRVEWADGGAERDISRLWREIEENISRFLDHEPGHTPTSGEHNG